MSTLYHHLGADTTLHKLVNRFYDLMDTLPEAATIRAMHPSDLSSSREKLFQFLSGWTGGPQLYIEQHGHPRLRQRHLPFVINDDARDAWMHCMTLAINETISDPLIRQDLLQALQRTADFMRNQ
jgi:hemoglobin